MPKLSKCPCEGHHQTRTSHFRPIAWTTCFMYRAQHFWCGLFLPPRVMMGCVRERWDRHCCPQCDPML